MADLLPQIPHSLEAEQHALLRLVLVGEQELATLLVPDDFHDPLHRMVFEAASSLVIGKGTCDLVLLSDHLRNNETFMSVGGIEFLMNLYQNTHFIAPATSAVEVLKRKRASRVSLALNKDLHNLVQDGEIECIPSLLQEHSKKLAELLPRQGINREELVEEMLRKDAVIPFGVPSMDNLINGGLAPGDLFLIAARPRLGKSSLATTLVANFLKQGIVPAFFSLEMSRRQVLRRILCAYHSVLPSVVEEKARELLDEIKTDFHLLGETSDLAAIQADVLSLDAQVIIIDYFGLITMQSKEQRFQQYEDISRSLKNLARFTGKPIVLLWQLSRDIEKDGKNRQPRLSDLYGGGEKDADMISFLWDPNATTELAAVMETKRLLEGDDATSELHWLLRKHRNGPEGDVVLCFDKPKFFMYEDLSGRFKKPAFEKKVPKPAEKAPPFVPLDDLPF